MVWSRSGDLKSLFWRPKRRFVVKITHEKKKQFSSSSGHPRTFASTKCTEVVLKLLRNKTRIWSRFGIHKHLKKWYFLPLSCNCLASNLGHPRIFNLNYLLGLFLRSSWGSEVVDNLCRRPQVVENVILRSKTMKNTSKKTLLVNEFSLFFLQTQRSVSNEIFELIT